MHFSRRQQQQNFRTDLWDSRKRISRLAVENHQKNEGLRVYQVGLEGTRG